MAKSPQQQRVTAQQMPQRNRVKPVLVFACGNPSRGDDSLGPALAGLITSRQRQTGAFRRVEVLTDFQLQIEHALDLLQRERVLFIDASVDARPPYEFHALAAAKDYGYTSHIMTPAAVLAVYQQIRQQAPCPAFVLSIRGYGFDLGADLSPRAREHLEVAHEFVAGLLDSEMSEWVDRAASAA